MCLLHAIMPNPYDIAHLQARLVAGRAASGCRRCMQREAEGRCACMHRLARSFVRVQAQRRGLMSSESAPTLDAGEQPRVICPTAKKKNE